MSKAPAFWHKPNVLARCLWPLSRLYWLLARRRMARYAPFTLSLPVICVGNNIAGGSGKTPTVLAIVHLLREKGYNPAVISRGYKGSFDGCVRVDPQRHNAVEVGDEPLLIARTAPCYVARKRLQAARAAIAEGADIIVMDDGMQNPSLHKDVTVMVVDGGYGFGNGMMLPAGPCREPVAQSLAKASMVLVIGEPMPLLHTHVFSAQFKPQKSLPDKPFVAFSGIARPQKFFDTLRQMGAQIKAEKSFADHHYFTHKELEALKEEAARREAVLMTTEKDWLRLDEAWRAQIDYLPVALEFADAQGFANALSAALKIEE